MYGVLVKGRQVEGSLRAEIKGGFDRVRHRAGPTKDGMWGSESPEYGVVPVITLKCAGKFSMRILRSA